MTLTQTKTVRELAIELPNATRVFEKLRIDYCCGGGKSLSDACEAAGIEVADVLRLLEESEQKNEAQGEVNFQSAPLTSLMS